MTTPRQIPQSFLLRNSGFILAKLRRHIEAWPVSSDKDRLLKIACLAFAANSHLLIRELVSVQSSYTCSALVLRTLWHNAAELAWLLNGSGDIIDRLDAFRADHDIRAKNALLDRPIRMFGHTVAASLLSTPELRSNADEIRTKAAEAIEHIDISQESEKIIWSKLRTPDLWKALRVSFDVASKDLGAPIVAILSQSEEAVGAGDNVAHPNPFVMLTVLNLVDLEAFKMARQFTPVEDATKKALFLAGHLLLAHCVAIYAHDKALFPLPKILEDLDRHLKRKLGD